MAALCFLTQSNGGPGKDVEHEDGFEEVTQQLEARQVELQLRAHQSQQRLRHAWADGSCDGKPGRESTGRLDYWEILEILEMGGDTTGDRV